MITTRKVTESRTTHEYTYIKIWCFSECLECIPFEYFYFHGVSQMMRYLFWAKVVYSHEGEDV